MDENRKHSQKKLVNGCTTLMYACQNGLTSKVINEIRNKVCVNVDISLLCNSYLKSTDSF